jgi:hypothetical protein
VLLYLQHLISLDVTLHLQNPNYYGRFSLKEDLPQLIMATCISVRVSYGSHNQVEERRNSTFTESLNKEDIAGLCNVS